MKFWPALLLASGTAASAVLDPPLVAPGRKADLFAQHHRYDHREDGTAGSGSGSGSSSPPSPRRIPTSAESAVLARRILALTPFGTIATVFPHDSGSAPSNLDGLPIGLPEYLADCEDDSGNPTLLAITIATSFRNARAGSNVSLALQWEPPYAPAQRRSVLDGLQTALGWGPSSAPVPSVAALPRFSLLGYLEPITGQDEPTSDLAACFVKTHPDARWWLPGNSIHKSEWLRLVVTNVYWIGGFGDRAYIGWIPVDEWHNVSRADWEKVRLPGEKKGWKESEVGYRL
ncbi:hypothetical protein CMQ_5512 [Grosmannia clavigera kw1407]|uniref:CREG-like beta-barrel domain-containing protein n=1 Tax=Grosmannia clavigera (strain kw1407 / UAMH 11150) TaxID=655863 RepID=F0XTB2_GROCL|nr:uncharacterized protein CMQ_5512 [Grosmannia clavigera kw1407]EFW99091.1 hypothetical protein CMQ_5512 [Grosmannia clavigera kw1407]